jgi:hypothetical protein
MHSYFSSIPLSGHPAAWNEGSLARVDCKHVFRRPSIHCFFLQEFEAYENAFNAVIHC